jgi:hypothetical protein
MLILGVDFSRLAGVVAVIRRINRFLGAGQVHLMVKDQNDVA